ncbi:hypothetical protein BsWGS_20466 [Bradybaena similaris]
MNTDVSTHVSYDVDGIDPVTFEVRQACMVIILVIVSGFVSLFGMGANIINIVVFVRQGFRDSVNISLCGLAIADLASVTTTFWSSILYNPEVSNADLPFNAMDVLYLTGGYAHACFNRVTSFVTAFVTLERCLCITFPLHIKTIFTPTRTKIIIINIFLVIIVIFSPFYYVNRLEWTFDEARNKTILSLVYTDNRIVVETFTFLIHSVAMSAISLSSVIVCTGILIIKLNQKTKWRQGNAVQSNSKPETASLKDKKVVKMVAFISTIFIICFTPATAIFLTMACYPEFSFGGRYQNMFYTVWAFATLLEIINSSVNIFIYLSMSSKFKITFIDIFCCKK